MKISTHYNRIDREVYEFDEADIKDALIKKAGIKYESGKRVEFEINTGDEDNNYKITATITVVWETPTHD